MQDHPGQGKLQRASHAFRMELNTRLFNGALGPELLPWINETPEIQHICADHFEGESVSAKNLSDYRRGAYQKWLAATQEIERQKTRAQFALELARASGGEMSLAAAQLMAGRYVDAFSVGDESNGTPDPKTVMAVAALRQCDLEHRKLEQKERALNQKDADFAWRFSAKILEAVENHWNELQTVAASSAPAEQRQMDVARIVFGDDLLELIEQRRKEALAS